MCAPPDCAERLAEVGVPLVPFGPPVHTLVHGAAPPTAADVPRRVAEVTAAAFDKIGAAAEGCAAVLASGVMPAVAAARSVAEKRGIWSASVSYCPIFLPSPHHPPFPLPGYPAPPGVTDHQVLDDLNVQSYNALYGPALNANRASAGLAPVGNVRDFIVGEQPWLAADPVLAPWPSRPISTSCRPARGWCRTNARSRPVWPRSWTPARHRSTWGSAACAPRRTSPGWPSRRSARRATAPSSAAAGPAWPRSTPGMTASRSARSTSRHCSAGWPPSCTTAARAPRRPPPGPARPRWWYRSGGTSRTWPAGWRPGHRRGARC